MSLSTQLRRWSALTAITLILLGCAGVEMKTEQRQPQTPYLGKEFWPAISSPVGLDPNIEQRIIDILARMTLEEKVGQIIQAEIQYVTPQDVKDYHLGSVLNGGGSLPGRNKHATPGEWLALADAYYDASMDASDGSTPIPIIWGSDAVHGHSNVIGATLFPHNIGLGAMRDPVLIREIGRVTALEMRATGIDWTFAPTLAVTQDDRWGRTYESYSEDPQIVKSYAGEFVIGLQGAPGSTQFLDVNRVVATAKHYLGDGGTEEGDDQGNTKVSEAELRDVHGQGYVTALEAGVQTVMASFSSWNGEKMHGHRYLLTEVLKEQMGFDGLIVGDWNGHGQLPGCTNASCPDTINAGLDLFMAIEDWKDLYKNTLEQARDGVIPSSRLDDAVRRVLRVKLRLGLFEEGRPSGRGVAGSDDVIGHVDHRAVAREAVRKSLVLMKNENNLLPINPASHILVTGDGADDMGKQTGGWTITWQGTDNEKSDFPGGTSILDGIEREVSQAGGRVTYSPDGDFETKPDVAIVVFGEEPYAEFQGDRETLEFEPVHKPSLELLKMLKDAGIPVVSVFLSGRPMWVNPEMNQSDAFVAAWLPGSEGVGVSDVLIAEADGKPRYDFTGRLSFSWPSTPLQGKLNAHHDDYQPLFAIGYGLDYATEAVGFVKLEEDVPGIKNSDDGDITLYHGRPLAPWAIFLEGDRSQASILSGAYATHVSGQVSVQTTDMEVQEDALKVSFTGTGKAGIYLSGAALDMTRFYEGGLLRFQAKVSSVDAMEIMVGLNEEEQLLANFASADATDDWQQIDIPIRCFVNDASALESVGLPFRLKSNAVAEVSVGKIQLIVGAQADTGAASCN